MPNMYSHFKRHQPKDVAKKIEDEKDALHRDMKKGLVKLPPQYVSGIPLAVLGDDVKPHEVGLDEFIKLGREKLNRGEMPINAATYLQAIKTKADIDKANKDRGVDVFKTMFKGAAPEPATIDSDGTRQPEGA